MLKPVLVGTPTDEVVVATGGCTDMGGAVNDCCAEAPLFTELDEAAMELWPVAEGAVKLGGCMLDAVFDS